MSAFGEKLRQARESQGISIQQAAMETRIMQQSLIALEEGNVESLPNEVVVKGFLRNYATYLNLSPNEIVELYQSERKQQTEPIRVVPATSFIPERSYVLPSFFGVFFVTIALIGLTYVVLNMTGYLRSPRYAYDLQPEESISSPPTPTPLVSFTPHTLAADSAHPITDFYGTIPTTPVLPTTPMPEITGQGRQVSGASNDFVPAPATPPLAAGGVFPTETPVPEYPIVVRLMIIPNAANSWLRVIVDGIVAFEGIMRSGEQATYQAQQYVHIRAGNPPVVHVGVNGADPEPLGTVPGDPVNWFWPPDRGQSGIDL